jgi:hypothetical protein
VGNRRIVRSRQGHRKVDSKEKRTFEEDLPALWQKTRAGARAGRGFHVQHLFAVLILVRQWAGKAPAGSLVPEGLDDCVLELERYAIWIQVKSRNKGTFSAAEVSRFQDEIEAKAASIEAGKKIRTVVALERPRSGVAEQGVDQLFDFDAPRIVLCDAPQNAIVELLTNELGTAEVIAEGIFSDLYKLVAETSAENASLPFEQRRRISTTEVERRITERLEAEDTSAIDYAIVSRVLEPIDFTTPIKEPSFYRGVKVQPGHVAAGLVFERPGEMENVVAALRQQRHVLVAGQSGAGKSALMWLAVHALAGEVRWFQVTAKANIADSDAIVRFVRARRPTESSPLGLAFDDFGSASNDLWNVLVRELRALPAVFLLGSIRREDTSLIANQSDTTVIQVSLSERLAQAVWERLRAQGHTNWSHWREPYEQSKGLMLEYVHLLTQGERLALVVAEQVQRREREGRRGELAILRTTSALCARGGEVEASKLFSKLGLTPDDAAQALRRLLDEHLVRESRPGVLGGLHALRSNELQAASHDGIVFLEMDSLWRSLTAATIETLPRIVQSVLADVRGEAETVVLRKMAETLGANHHLDVWTSILMGLGLATLERRVSSFIAVLDQHDVPRSQWSLASMFADPGIEIPELSEFDQWQKLRNAVLAFRALPKHDMRSACLDQLLKGSELPLCGSLRAANRFLSSLAPICGSDPVRIQLPFDFPGMGDHDIREVAALLSTAYLFGRDSAQTLVDSMGGEALLLGRFGVHTPWVAEPVIEPEGIHGRTVRANWFHVAEAYQSDPHQTMCDICETLLALSPHSDAAACDTVNALGQIITIGNDFVPFSKNMPRQNIPAKTRVAWNVAFRQIMLARSAADSLTVYVQHIAPLVVRTEKVLRSYSEKWSKGKGISNAAELAAEVNEILAAVNALAFAAPEQPSDVMTAQSKSSTADDTLGALLTSTLGNLLVRLGGIHGKEGAKAAAVLAGSLAAEAEQHRQSSIWRVSSSPPLKELAAMAEKLNDISCILHEMAHEDQAAIRGILNFARKATPGKAVRAAARHCRSLAHRRFLERLGGLEQTLSDRGWKAKCFARPIDERDSVHWPASEVAVLVEIASVEGFAHYAADALAAAQEFLGVDWRFRIVPVMNGRVLASLALLPSLQMLLPDQEFPRTWGAHINIPFLVAETEGKFEAAFVACMQLSGIIACRNLDRLHPVEEEVVSKVIKSFKDNRSKVVAVADSTGSEYFTMAVHYLDGIWNHTVAEFEALKAGKRVETPLCVEVLAALTGQENERTRQLAALRLLLLQAECEAGETREVQNRDDGMPPGRESNG